MEPHKTGTKDFIGYIENHYPHQHFSTKKILSILKRLSIDYEYLEDITDKAFLGLRGAGVKSLAGFREMKKTRGMIDE
jgi:hypothetical protein